MQQKLLEIFIEQLESGKYSDLELAQNLIKQALLLNSDPVIALRAASEIVRRDTPSGGGWSYEKGKFYYKRHSNENFDDSGFGELADIIQPNQIGHFVAEAYIAAYQKRARFGVNPDLLVWGHEIKNLGSQPIKQIQIEQDLGYIAVDLGEILVINSALTPDEQLALAIDAVETAVSSIQSYSYADAHPITYWWNTFKWPWSK